jgi:hypothetical protein
MDGDIVTTGPDAIITHPLSELDIVLTKPTKRFSGETSMSHSHVDGD